MVGLEIMFWWMFAWFGHLVWLEIWLVWAGWARSFGWIWLGCSLDLVGWRFIWIGDLVGIGSGERYSVLGWIGDLFILENWLGWRFGWAGLGWLGDLVYLAGLSWRSSLVGDLI